MPLSSCCFVPRVLFQHYRVHCLRLIMTRLPGRQFCALLGTYIRTQRLLLYLCFNLETIDTVCKHIVRSGVFSYKYPPTFDTQYPQKVCLLSMFALLLACVDSLGPFLSTNVFPDYPIYFSNKKQRIRKNR